MDKISLGIDIATSISVIGAAISFMISQHKTRRQSQAQYAVSNLKDFLKFINSCKAKFDADGNELRTNPNQENLNKNKLQVIFVLEDIKRELTTLIEIYFPIFSTEPEIPDSLKTKATELDALLRLAKGNGESFMDSLKEIEPFLYRLEYSVALELKTIMQKR